MVCDLEALFDVIFSNGSSQEPFGMRVEVHSLSNFHFVQEIASVGGIFVGKEDETHSYQAGDGKFSSVIDGDVVF